MIKIKTKPVTFLAMLLDDQFDITEFAREYPETSYHYKRYECELHIFANNPNGACVAKRGDYLVRNGNAVTVVDAETFGRLFEIVPG